MSMGSGALTGVIDADRRRVVASLPLSLLAACVSAPPAPPRPPSPPKDSNGSNAAPASSAPSPPAPAPAPGGQTKGSAWAHTGASAARLIDSAMVSLPAGVNGFPNVSWLQWREMPRGSSRRVPVVILLHGSAGARVKAIEEWQRWLATLGVASVVPDSFALPDRLTYTSPVGSEIYERVHALRASEIDITLKAVRAASWADPQRVVLAGTSEGAVAVARHAGEGFAGRMIFSWSCEDNYFVREHRTAPAPKVPVLNVISASDPFFTAANPFLGATRPLGHCGAALAQHPRATVVILPGAPHTVLGVPGARHAVEGFLRETLRLDLH